MKPSIRQEGKFEIVRFGFRICYAESHKAFIIHYGMYTVSLSAENSHAIAPILPNLVSNIK
jgi:hypothetical protein